MYVSAPVRQSVLPAATLAQLRSNIGLAPGGAALATLGVFPGNIWYVDSNVVGGQSGAGTSWSASFLTLNEARAAATANNGDVVMVAPGHAETLTNATGFAASKAGITYIGCGYGADRPTITFGTNTTANIPISAASQVFTNFLFVCGVDSVVAAVTISAADCWIDNVEFRDTTDVEFVTPLLTTTGGNRLKVTNCLHDGFITGNACTEAFSLIGVDQGVIENCEFMGNYSTACINLLTTACTKLRVRNCTFRETGSTDINTTLKDTVGTSTWSMTDCFVTSLGRKIVGSEVLGIQEDAGDGWFYKTKADPSALASQTLFTYTGDVEFQIWAVVTTVIQGQSTTFKWTATADSLTVQDLCATKDINGFLAGSVITLTGTAITDAAISLTGVAVKHGFQDGRFLATCITSGIIAVVMGAGSTGAISHRIRWRPMTPGATVA